MAWKIVNFNPFASPAPEEEEPTGPAIPPGVPPGANVDRERQALTQVDLTKFGEAYDPFQAFQQTDEKAKAPAARAPAEERPEGWAAAIDPQQYKEAAKGIAPGAIQFTGTTMQGLAAAPAVGQANAFKFGQGQQTVWDRIDRGEKVPEMEDAAGYQHMTADQRRQLRADASKASQEFKPTVLADQPLYKAGEAVKEYAKTVLPAAPGYESAVGRQLGEGLGSMLAGLPFGAIGRIPATIFFGAGGAGEAGTRAIAYDQAEKRAGRPGLTQEQINGAAIWGIAPGTTDLLPVEVILGRLRVPEPLKKPLAKAIGRIGGQAFIEGAQEGGQAFLQNAIAQDYNPSQGLTEGVAGEAGIGSGVGGIAQLGKELGGLALAGFGGRRGATAQPGQAPDAGAGDPFAQPLQPAPTGPAGEITTTGPIDVEFEDLVPADRRLPSPQVDRPAQQSGMEPPLSPTVSPQGRGWALPPAPAANTAPRGVLPPPSPSSSVPGSVDAAPAAPILQEQFGTTQDRAGGVSTPSVSAPAPNAPEMAASPNAISTQDIMYALSGMKPSRDNLGYYSKALESANGLKQEKGTSEQMLAQLKTAGVKDAEIKATGLDRFLSERPSVTKQEITDFLTQNRVQLQQNTYGFAGHPELKELREQLAQERAIVAGGRPRLNMAKANLPERADQWPESVRQLAIEVQRAEWNIDRLERDIRNIVDPNDWDVARRRGSYVDEPQSETRWRDYSLDPDNKTYREDVVSLGQDARDREIEARFREITPEWEALRGKPHLVPSEVTRLAELDKERLSLAAESRRKAESDFTSGHWDEPNIVAHIRSAIFTDNKGRQVYNLDELQSDWGQKIREGGTSDPEKTAELKRISDEASEWNSSRKAEAQKDLEANAQLLEPKLRESKPYGVIDYGIVNPEGEANWEGRYLVKGVTETPWNLGSLSGKITYWPQTFNWKGEPQGEAWIASADNGMFSNAQMRSLDGALDQIRSHIRKINIKKRLELATTRALNDGNTELARRMNGWIDAINEAEQKANLAYAEWQTAKNSAPGHPLVNTTDQWVTTALRRVIQQAADEGVDGITITPGKVQAERFDLSKKVKELVYDPQRQILTARLHSGGRGFTHENVPPEQLKNYVGKEAAEKLLASPVVDDTLGSVHRLSGLDMEMGGEGMKATYDGIYPRTLLKLLQKLDPSIKPEKTRLKPAGPGGEASEFDYDFTYFPLTQKAKAKLAEEGQPLFALGAKNEGRERSGDGGRRSASGSLAPLKGAPVVEGATGPDPRIVAAAEQYAAEVGIPLRRQAVFATVNEKLAGRIAQAYEEMAHNPRDPQVAAAYDDMIQQTIAQYRALEKAGYKFFFYDETNDPYEGNPWNSIRDLRQNQKMGVFATEAGFGSGATDLNVDDSPMLRDSGIRWPYGAVDGPAKRVLVNDLFRAVHDAFGHSMEGAGFRARGEENAWQAHIRLYYGPAVGAVTSETRGQNSWLNFGPYGEANRNASVEDTIFADQKIGLMPSWTWEEGRVGDEDGDPSFAVSTTDEDTQQEIRQAIGSGKIFHVPNAINNAVFRGLEGAMDAVPDDHYVAVLNRIIPLNTTTADLNEMAQAQYGKPHSRLTPEQQAAIEGQLEGEVGSVKIRAIFRDRAGEEFEMEGDLDTLLGVRAFYVQSGTRPGIGFTRLSLAGKFHESLRGELRHEITHALRVQGRIDPRSWGALLRHANNLSILDRDLKEYLSAIGHPLAEETEAGLTLRDAYEEAYDGMADLQERLDQESVAHLVELYSHGALGESAEPVKPLLDGIISGKYSKRAPWAEVEASLDQELTPQIKQLLQEELDAVARSDQGGQLSAAPGAGLQSGEPASARIAPRPEDFARSPRIGESLDRKRLAGRLRDKAIDRYLGGWFEPAAARQRAEMQGFTTPTWHGTRDLDFLVPNPAVPGKDWGFHMATTIPLAANDRIGMSDLAMIDNPWKEAPYREWRVGGNVMPLLVKAKKPFRIHDLGAWDSPTHWRGTEGWVHSWQSTRGYDHEHQEAAYEISVAAERFDRMPYSAETNRQFQEKLIQILEAYGYDHILYANTAEGNGEDSMIVWRPEQVRSANDLFDPRAVGSPGLFASTPFLEADLRERLNEMLVDEARMALFALQSGAGGDLAQTSAFKRWFGDSKVVDAEGKPRIVYHGTERAGFDRFDPYMQNKSSGTGATGFYFTNHPLGAETYSGTRADALVSDDPDFDPRLDGSPGNYAVFLSMKNPLVVDFQNEDGYSGSWDDAPEDSGFGGQSINDIAEYAEGAGFDGVIATNIMDEGAHGNGYGWGDTTYIVFSPNQIKSAFNRGTFDPNDDRIMYALAGKRAIGAPKGLLPTAERMQERGAKPDQIWQQTGWAQGPDTKWRWEIDDSRARITNLDKILAGAKASPGFFKRIMGGQQKSAPAGGIQKQTNIPLINLLDHPQLYSAYPFLRQMRVDLTYGAGVQERGALREKTARWTEGDDPRGHFNVKIYKPIQVSASSPEGIKSVLMHEIQHYIQNREGFSKGSDFRDSGRPSTFVTDEKQSTALYDPGRDDDWVNTTYGRDRKTLLKMTLPEQNALAILEAFAGLDKARARKAAGETKGERGHADIDTVIKEYEALIKDYGRVLELSMLVDPKDYRNSAGEWEAREVQNRLNMSAAERQKQSPFANAPANLGNTSGQTRDYSKAYDEVMRRAEVFKAIKERWAQRQPVVPGLSVMRTNEANLEYVAGSEEDASGMVIVRIDDDQTARLFLADDFLNKPYAEQKRFMDGIMRDLNKRNLIVSGAKPNGYELQDKDIPFWKRYDPTKIAFDLRLYREEIMEKARERYGDDVEVEINPDDDDDGVVIVTTPKMKADFLKLEQDFEKVDQQYANFQNKLVEKYGWNFMAEWTKQEKDRYEAMEKKSADLQAEMIEGSTDYLDLDFIFEGRDSHARPAGVDYETWMRAVAEEQLLRMGKMPRPGEEVDFEDLIPSQEIVGNHANH